MEFKKYNSIENTYRTAHLDKIKEYGLNGGDWVVTEKVHGANFSIWYDGVQFKFGKRTAFVGSGSKLENGGYYTHPIGKDSFYNWATAVEQDNVLSKIEHIYNSYCNEESTMIVYGELFGGSYPHKDVEIPKVQCVQKGVFYSPKQHFYAFDIKIDGKFVDFFTFDIMCRSNDLFYAKALITGTLEECLEYPNDKCSFVPGWLELPEIENNIMEGVVIKPIFPSYFPNGERVILKNKNEKFKENSKGPKTKVPQMPVEFSPDGKKMYDEFLTYICENRLRNVLSKIGEVTNKDFGKILGELIKDAFEDFLKDYPEFKTLEAGERKMMTKAINKEAATFIRKDFLNIIDGVY